MAFQTSKWEGLSKQVELSDLLPADPIGMLSGDYASCAVSVAWLRSTVYKTSFLFLYI